MDGQYFIQQLTLRVPDSEPDPGKYLQDQFIKLDESGWEAFSGVGSHRNESEQFTEYSYLIRLPKPPQPSENLRKFQIDIGGHES